MYIALVPTMYFLFQRLLYANGEGRPQLRTLATWIYLLHPLCLILVRGGAKATGLAWLLIDQSLVRYVAVCTLSLVLALIIVALRKRAQPVETPDRAWLEMDLDALIHNAQTIQEQLPPGCAIMAVVKANAYGHGSVVVAKTLAKQGISAFAVATLQEAIALRKQGLKGEILILGYTPPVEAPLLSRYRLTQTLVDYQHAQTLAAQGCRLQVQIKVDTGMRRLGESYLHSQQIRQMFQYDTLQVTGIYTHLCAADSDKPEDKAFTNVQIQNFTQLLQQLAAWGISLPKVHIQSSYGLFNYPGLAWDYVRPGIALYGAKSAHQDLLRAAIQLKPVLALRARIIEVKDLSPGETVGYGRCFTAPRAMRIATLAIGYGDGVPRNLRGGQVLIKGRLAPIIGRICMDTLMVDISQLPEIQQGDQATLIGADGDQRILAEDLAQQAGTITNELFCGFGNRLPKLYRQDSKTASQAKRRRGKENS